ncbi:hypothetical protein KKC59_03435, partial [bacterium]|nr:hypothetical protein [bacterium]
FYFANLLKGFIAPLVAIKLFAMIAIILLPISFYVFLSTINKNIKWLSLFSFIFLYNETYYFGNLNLLLSFSLFFFGLACLESILKKFRVIQLILLLFLTAFLFYAHSLTFIIFLIAGIILLFSHKEAGNKISMHQIMTFLLVLVLALILSWSYFGVIWTYLKVFFDRSLTESSVLLKWIYPWPAFLHLIASPGGVLFGLAKLSCLVLLALAIFHPLFNKEQLLNLGKIFNDEPYSSQRPYIYVAILLLMILFLMPGGISFVANAEVGIENNSFFKLNYQLVPLISLFIITILPAQLYHANYSKYLISLAGFIVIGITIIFHLQFQKEMKSFDDLINLMEADKNMLVINANPVSNYFAQDFPIFKYVPTYYIYQKQGVVSDFLDQGYFPVRLIQDKKPPLTLFNEDKKLTKEVLTYYAYYLFRFAGDAFAEEIAVTKTNNFLKQSNINKIATMDKWHLYEKK